MCQRECLYDDEASTPGSISCRLPSIPTTYSNQNFNIGKVEQKLNSGKYFGSSDAEAAFDDSVFTRVNDNSNTCILGMEFAEGYVGSLRQVKYFMNYITNRPQYVGNLAFEGSNVGQEEGYVELF